MLMDAALSSNRLKRLSISRPQATTLETLLKSLSSSNETSLKEVALSGTTLDPQHAQKLATILAEKSCELQELSLKHCTIADLNFFTEGLFKNQSLKNIDLFGCRMNDSHLSIILEALCNHPMLHKLDLGRNSIGPNGFRALSKLLETTALQHICLREQHAPLDLKYLTASATKGLLDLSYNRLTNLCLLGAWSSLCLRQCTYCNQKEEISKLKLPRERLDLSGTTLADAAVIHSSEQLTKDATRLQELCLYNCRISQGGMLALADKLPHMSSLRVLQVHGQQQYDKSIQDSIVQGLITNFQLRQLQLSFLSKEIQYWLHFNTLGRQRLLQQPIHAASWPTILEQMGTVYNASSFVYDLLREKVLAAR